jgi:hypothetical protein
MLGLYAKVWAIANLSAAVAAPLAATYPEITGKGVDSLNEELPADEGLYVGVAGDEKGDIRTGEVQVRVRVAAVPAPDTDGLGDNHAEMRCYRMIQGAIRAFNRVPGEDRDFPAPPAASGLRVFGIEYQSNTTPEPDGEGGEMYTSTVIFRLRGSPT